LYVVGVAVIVGSLVGARALTAGNGNAADPPKTANPVPKSDSKTGPVVLGTVDSNPGPVQYGLPPVIQSGTISEVFVKEGQEVKKGDKLFEFDTSILTRDLERAVAAVALARTKVAEAEEGAKQHELNIEVAKQVVTAAENKERLNGVLYNIVKGNLEKGYKAENVAENLWQSRFALNPDLYKANVDYDVARQEVMLQKAKVKVMEAADPKVMIKQAEAGVAAAQAEVNKAKTAIELCTVRAKTAGTIEQIKTSPGATLGISTRDPALWLIPGGPRIVRGEVEADFAHRVKSDLVGKEVIISDHTDPKLTYKGTVSRVGGTFLPKRDQGLLGNETRVIEVVIEVAEPTGDEKHPLRVGQRVRVNLGQ